MQRLAAGTMLLVGALAWELARRADQTSTAAQLLGVLLVVLGVAGAVTSGAQTTTIDLQAQTITIDDERLTGLRRRRIHFDEIDDVALQGLGDSWRGLRWYFLRLRLRGGERVALFPPGRFYRGTTRRAVVESWRTRLNAALGERDVRTA